MPYKLEIDFAAEDKDKARKIFYSNNKEGFLEIINDEIQASINTDDFIVGFKIWEQVV